MPTPDALQLALDRARAIVGALEDAKGEWRFHEGSDEHPRPVYVAMCHNLRRAARHAEPLDELIDRAWSETVEKARTHGHHDITEDA